MSMQTEVDRVMVAHFVRPDVFLPKLTHQPVILKRTYNQKWEGGATIRYWRVMTEGHRNYGSDLSIDGMRYWGIIR